MRSMFRAMFVLITILLLGACGSSPAASPVATPSPTSAVQAVPVAVATLAPVATPKQAPTPLPTAEPRDFDAEFAAAIAGNNCTALAGLVGEMPDSDEEWPVTDATISAAAVAMTSCVNGNSTIATLVPRGTKATVGDWSVKVTGKVNFNAWKVVKRENMFNDPAPKG